MEACRLKRLEIQRPTPSEKAVKKLYEDLARRGDVASAANCPVDQCAAFVRQCLSQSCGKCVPCRVGLRQMSNILDRILDGAGKKDDIVLIERLAHSIYDSADCAIGFEAAECLLNSLQVFQADLMAHIERDCCVAKFAAVPCKAGCPAHVDIPGYIALVKAGRYADAVRVIRYDNPFPAACAMVCEHPCEHACRRNMVDDAINIRAIKRMAVEHAGEVSAPACLSSTGKKVAVVGGGPSGLTAAYFLRLMGHQVTVLEQRRQLGGMMRYGIPRYRLPASYLDADIQNILSTGVKVQTDVPIHGADYENLREEYDAVYLAIGAHKANGLGIEGEDSENVISAVELLRAVGDGGKPDFAGKRVVVVGGGNVAMDCTRTAMRLGAKEIRCVYRRRQSDMTALAEEIESTIAETCEVVPMMAPVRVETDSAGKVSALIVQPQIPGKYEGGRPKPIRATKNEVRMECDIIIAAIGQAVDSRPFAESGVATKHNRILCDTDCMVSEGVFSGGDCTSGPSTVIRAVEAGKTAAANIDAYLGYSHVLKREVEIPLADGAFKAPTGRVNLVERRAAERKNDFEAVELNMSEQECAQECGRCLRCDLHGYGAFRGGERQAW